MTPTGIVRSGPISIWGAVDCLIADRPIYQTDGVDSRSVGLFSCVGSVPNSPDTRRSSPDRFFPHLTITGDVWLHNRAELLSVFGIQAVERDCADLCLIVLAYEKWGKDCGQHLLGEFSFSIWDARHRLLFCCRDHMGFRPFLYWSRGSRFVFASNIRLILGVEDVPRELNLRRFADLGGDRTTLSCHSDTFHAGIHSLRPGTALTVDRTGLHIHSYWVPVIRPELVPRRPEDAIEALREILIEAVECRIPEDGAATVELSGGLDSSGVASIAARCMARKGRTLHALSGILPEDRLREYSDERDFIDEFRAWPNIQIQYVSASGRGPFDTIETPQAFVETPVRAPFFYLHEEFKKVSLQHGARHQLRGLQGELGLTSKADAYYVELALKLRWATLANELIKLRDVQGLRPLRHLGGRFWDLLRPAPAYSNNGGILLAGELATHMSVDRMPSFRSPSQRGQQLRQIEGFLGAHATWWGRTVEDGIRFSHPWIDKRVIEFCLAAPPELKVKNGYRRHLIRSALDGILPERIQWRTSKSPFSPDYYARYDAQLGMVRNFLAAIGPRDPIRSAIDIQKLSALVRPDSSGVALAARDVVPANIYAICFLRQFTEFRG